MSFKRGALTSKRFRSIKPEIRVLGVDDGIFVPRTKGTVDVIGVVYRGGYWIDGVMRTEVTIDGMDATKNIAEMIKKAPHYAELRIVILDGLPSPASTWWTSTSLLKQWICPSYQ